MGLEIVAHLCRHLHGKIAAIGSVRILLCSNVLKSENSEEEIQLTMWCAALNGNPYATMVTWSSLTNANEKTDITNFFNDLCSLILHIDECNVLISGGDVNPHVGKDENGKFCLFKSLKKKKW